ncbi:MAG: TRAM domain-containing protein [Syntrophobacterales bacterium]|nr:TRAM domain-containing protein [Syntrophobacterales bacterium]
MGDISWVWVLLKVFIIVVCGIGGYFITAQVSYFSPFSWAPFVGALLGGIIATIVIALENIFRRLPLKRILGGTLGLILGLFIARLIGGSFTGLQNPTVQVSIYVILCCLFGYIGTVLGSARFAELMTGFPWFGKSSFKGGGIPKILDTSVLIDGRVVDVVEAGFLEGPLVVPDFVIHELQHIADSQDQLRRAKGRRGLDIMKRLQESKQVETRIERHPIKDSTDVDTKLVALAIRLQGKIITNDSNLAKVAEVNGIQVLNMHRLAHAMRPVVMPGEVLRLQILREGREQGQGIAYLEDGTMVVVENASKYLGKEVEVSVTSVLQTPVGRMVFTALKTSDDGRQH